MAETIRFWLGMEYRGDGLKRLDKILVGNSDTEKSEYIDLSDLLKVFTTDDLNESQTKKYITPELLQKLENLSEGNYTLEQLGQYFYPKSTNPEGYLTSQSELAAAKIAGTLAASLIPGLAASKITSGTFSAARIPDLSASKITSGVFDLARIPNIPASKLEDFTTELGKYMLKTAIGAANGVAPLNENSQLPEAYIQNLNANKITSGTFAESLIPSVFLKLSQIVDDLTSEDPEALLSANQGRVLNEKINGIAGSKWLGEFTSKANLLAAYPEGDEQLWHENLPGWNADVDAGEDVDIEHYIFDLSDKEWVKQLGRSNVETATSVQQKYESNPDTYRLTEVRKNKVDSLKEFNQILENQYGNHPDFDNQNDLNIWLLQNIGNSSEPQPTAPTMNISNITSESFDYEVTE
ncbi:hypothetical protein INR75_02780 [Zunongwangia sp. SCSIO 43204]|uniref:hypothetical protein n=1 Tax=Zunongwangia sp. SCSIO 43204 TaxID=2779359 RepID=UPI001CA8E794|nr:hypothetical protein [Zunongwangia sp. SCSIO 43204]UAB84972.1 hypothetical protein INR75_02780 [Zunongwangia sp. SCSIO 43204]